MKGEVCREKGGDKSDQTKGSAIAGLPMPSQARLADFVDPSNAALYISTIFITTILDSTCSPPASFLIRPFQNDPASTAKVVHRPEAARKSVVKKGDKRDPGDGEAF